MNHRVEECDVLVVGSGAGGLVGALTAAREGFDTILVESTNQFGGTSAYSGGGGMWFPANPVVVREGTNDTVEDALEYYHAVVGDRTPYALQEAYVRTGARLIEYLEQESDLKFQVMRWPDYYGKAPKSRGDGQRHITARPLKISKAPQFRDLIRGPLDVERRGAPVPNDYYIGGRALVARLLKAITQYPTASLRLNTPFIDLIRDDAGVVVGAVVEHNGSRSEIRVRRGVLLAAGGFETNQEMRDRYGVPGDARDTMGAPGCNGGAHISAIAAGADTDLMDQAWWSPGLIHPDGRAAFALCFTGGIFVDNHGKRFVNESAAYDRIGRAVIERLDKDLMTLPFWMIYDDKAGVVPPVKAPNVSMDDTAKYLEARLWRTADTLEELAGDIGVPPQALVDTVHRFNAFTDSGDDSEFGRGDEPYDRAFTNGESPLVAIEQPPFHAAAFGISDLGTKGGLRTDADGRVLDANSTVIRGLYAAGNTMAAPSGTTYPGGGNPIGSSMVFSHRAVIAMCEGRSRDIVSTPADFAGTAE